MGDMKINGVQCLKRLTSYNILHLSQTSYPSSTVEHCRTSGITIDSKPVEMPEKIKIKFGLVSARTHRSSITKRPPSNPGQAGISSKSPGHKPATRIPANQTVRREQSVEVSQLKLISDKTPEAEDRE